MIRCSAIFAAVALCSAVCAWVKASVPVVAVVPFEAAGADFLVVGNVFALGDMAGVFVTMLGVKPPTATIAVRQTESLDALMAAVPGLCAELLESMADGGNATE